jgi:hypothetical protein
MAPLAIATEFTAVHIVLHVTVCAGFLHTDFFFNRIKVASKTFQRFMGSVESKFGLGIVVILPKAPAVWIVAVRTLISKTLFMLVCFFVADDTVAWCVFKGCPEMTSFARSDRVHADQWETRQVMLESDIGTPAALIVTVVTSFPLLATVCIIQAVAAVTVCGQLFAVCWPGVAFVAGHFRVLVA